MWLISGPFDGGEAGEVDFQSGSAVSPFLSQLISQARDETSENWYQVRFGQEGAPTGDQ
jgi:hypothetical protein